MVLCAEPTHPLWAPEQMETKIKIYSEYDLLGNRTRLNYPSGGYITYTLDELNRVKQIKDRNAQIIAEYSYAGPTRVKSRAYGNGVHLDIQYDGLKRAKEFVHTLRTAPEQLVAGFKYGFDKEGNRLYEKRTHPNKDAQSDVYAYDSIYRLTGVEYRVPDPASHVTKADISGVSREGFVLDGVGNRVSVTKDAQTVSYTTNNLNQYTAVDGKGLEYDRNGNLKKQRRTTKTTKGLEITEELEYFYDYANRLVRVAKREISQTAGNTRISEDIARYSYDALGRRTGKTVYERNSIREITYFYYDGARCIKEEDGRKNTIAAYVFGNGIDEVLTIDKGIYRYYYHENSLGSITALTNEQGEVIERYEYEAYGKPKIMGPASEGERPCSIIGNRIMFTGREYDYEAGLYYYRARYYSDELGKFLQRDLEEVFIAINMLNFYAYAALNPTNRIDPWGWIPNKGQAVLDQAMRQAKIGDLEGSKQRRLRWETVLLRQE